MLLSELIKRLSRGPLSNLSMSNEGDGTINPARLPAVLDYINDGLKRIYTKFNLLEKELILQLIEGKTNYRLNNKFAQSRAEDFPDNDHYIIDAFDPFPNDLIQVLAVNRTGGLTLPLNDDGAPNSLYTPQVDVLQVPTAWPGVPLFVMYQATHVPVLLEDVDNEDYEIDLPVVLEAALEAFVAYKVFDHMVGQEHQAKGQGFLSLFDATCGEVEEKDLVNATQSHTNMKFHQRGFV